MSEDVLARITKLAEVDLVRLLDAVEEADDALLEFETGRRVAKSTAAPAPPRHGKKAEPPRAPRVVSPRPLREAWEAIRGQIVSHVESEQKLVLPTCKHIVGGHDALRGGLRVPLRQMITQHRTISEAVLVVRLEAARVEPVRREFLTVCRMWDEHVQEEESLIFPEALAELTDEIDLISTNYNLVSDADNIGARLRLAAVRNTALAEAKEEAEPESMMGRFRRFLKR